MFLTSLPCFPVTALHSSTLLPTFTLFIHTIVQHYHLVPSRCSIPPCSCAYVRTINHVTVSVISIICGAYTCTPSTAIPYSLIIMHLIDTPPAFDALHQAFPSQLFPHLHLTPPSSTLVHIYFAPSISLPSTLTFATLCLRTSRLWCFIAQSLFYELQNVLMYQGPIV